MTSTPGLAAADLCDRQPSPKRGLCDGLSDSDGIPDLVYTDDSEFDCLNLYLLKNIEYEKKEHEKKPRLYSS